MNRRVAWIFACVATLSGCGGGDDAPGAAPVATPPATQPDTSPAAPPAPTPGRAYTLSGTVSGLTSGTLTLMNNGQAPQQLSSDGKFAFTSVPAGSTYNVTVSQHPVAVQCNVVNAAGTLNSDVGNVAVTCHPGQFTTLHVFSGGNDGAMPWTGLAMDSAGNLFGTTMGGGLGDQGTVFELKRQTDGTYGAPVTLHLFSGTGNDGANPSAPLVLDSAGNLFGTTQAGGSNGRGTVFMLKRQADGTYAPATTLHSFIAAVGAGVNPIAGLVLDSAGNLFGTTPAGNGNYGTVFELNRQTDGTYGAAITLHIFSGAPLDGATPDAGVVLDSAGNLFGMTTGGGAHNGGTVFELKRLADGTYAPATTLYEFPGTGAAPYASLLLDGTGNLFGTTYGSGSSGKGTVFVLKRQGDGTYAPATTLYSFTGIGTDGANPTASLVLDSNENLFGTTVAGGSRNSGTVFELKRQTDGTYGPATTLYSIPGTVSDGSRPFAGLLLDSVGNLFGTTAGDGATIQGTVFQIN